jgi:peptidoglycan/LPS O-acetylase OafA/YrhL
MTALLPVSTAPSTSAAPRRLVALDGMRGVAALVVVIYHSSLIARSFLETNRVGDAWWWIDSTPLKLATAGMESVLVFFVLSGLVVALPALRPGFAWRTYYPARVLRLYVPVWGALLLGTLLIFAVHRDPSMASASSWLADTNASSVTPSQFLAEASLGRHTYDIDNVLWSLRWEMAFSVSLPVFVIAAAATRRWWFIVAPLALIAHITGRMLSITPLVYLPIFFLGTILAANLGALSEWAARRSRMFWTLEICGSLTLIILSYLTRGIAPFGSFAGTVIWGLAAAGAVGLIVAGIGSPAMRRFLTARVPRWLGKVSFSLYLVHVPILTTLAFLIGDQWWPLVIAIGIPLSLTVSWLFFRFVEKPSHKLAKWFGSQFAPHASSPLSRQSNGATVGR